MAQIVINGKFAGGRMVGQVRNALELIGAMDEQCSDMNITLLLPPKTEMGLKLKNIAVVHYGKHEGMLWEQIDLARYIRKHKGIICLNLCNVAPIFAPAGITAVLDIMYKVNPSHYTSLRNRFSRYWHVFQYELITRREKKIITISNFCKEEICRVYPRSKGKIVVIPCAWQHVLQYKENPNWQVKYPFLKEKNFYFSLSTLAKNKNGKWIMEVAKKNPDAVFAIAGKYYETEKYEIPANVYMLGVVPDEDACALMKHCKAFIHPSIYEGFGLPPLEALALGAKVISSNTSSLPEVLGNAVHYIDPYDYNINLEDLLAEPVGDSEETLSCFSWEKSATLLAEVVKKSTNEKAC